MPQGVIVLLYTNAMRRGLLAEPPTAEQMEKLLDGLLAPDERMIRGPNGMEPFVWLKEAEPDMLFLAAADDGGKGRAAGAEDQYSTAGARLRPNGREPGPGVPAKV